MQHRGHLLQLLQLHAARLNHAAVLVAQRVDVYGRARHLQPGERVHARVAVVHGGGDRPVPPDALELQPALGKDVELAVHAQIFQRRAPHPFAAAGRECERVVRLQKGVDARLERIRRHRGLRRAEGFGDQLGRGDGLVLALRAEGHALLHAGRHDRAVLACGDGDDVCVSAPVARGALGGEELAVADDRAEDVGRAARVGVIDDGSDVHGFVASGRINIWELMKFLKKYYNNFKFLILQFLLQHLDNIFHNILIS